MWSDKHRPGPRTCCASLLWRAKTSAHIYLSACLSLSDPHNDLYACLSVYLSVFIIVCICVRLTLTPSNFYLDLFGLLSTCVSSCLSLSACSFVFCHTVCLPLFCFSPAVLSAWRVCFFLFFPMWLYACLCLCPIGLCALLFRLQLKYFKMFLYSTLKPVSHIITKHIILQLNVNRLEFYNNVFVCEYVTTLTTFAWCWYLCTSFRCSEESTEMNIINSLI